MKRTCGVFLITHNDHVLLCHPTGHDKNTWSIPKGEREEGDSDFETALRELHEETNIDLMNKGKEILSEEISPIKYKHGKKELKPFFIDMVTNRIDPNKFDLKCVSYVHPNSNESFPEVDEYWWCHIDEIKKYVHETQAKAMDVLKKIKSNGYGR